MTQINGFMLGFTDISYDLNYINIPVPYGYQPVNNPLIFPFLGDYNSIDQQIKDQILLYNIKEALKNKKSIILINNNDNIIIMDNTPPPGLIS